MGEIAARLADVLVVTDDNPRSEDPAAIRAEVLAGADAVDAAEVARGRRPARGDPRSPSRWPRRATRSWSPARATRPARRSPAPCTRSTTASCSRPRCDGAGRPMIPMTLPRSPTSSAASSSRRRARRVVTGPAFLDSRVAERRAGCSSRSPASTSTATTTPPPRCAGGAAAVLVLADTGRARRSSSTTRVAALAALARHVAGAPAAPTSGSSRSPGRRARPPPRTCSPQVLGGRGADGRDGRLVQQRARPAAHRAARRRADPLPGARDGRPRRRPPAAARARSRRRESRWCSTSARRTSASSAPRRRSRRAKGELVEALGRRRASRCSTPTTRWSPRWRRVRGPGAHLRQRPRTPTCASSDVAARRPRPADLRPGRAGDERRTVTLGLIGEHHATNAAAAAAVALGRSAYPSTPSSTRWPTATATLARWRMELRERADGVTVRQRRLQRQPRLDARRAQDAGRDRPGPAGGAAPSRSSARCVELGASSREEHDAVGRLVVRLDIHQLLVVGEGAKPIHLGACLEGSWGGESVFVPDADAALAWLREHLRRVTSCWSRRPRPRRCGGSPTPCWLTAATSGTPAS